jgi:DNA-binding NarL/FixJ family response regulator
MKVIAEAANGAEALDHFRNFRPDVTLMDLQMPHMNGLDAIVAIRKEFPNARIIVLTTYAGDVQAVRALKAGAVGYLLKSSLRKELLNTIREIHAGRRHIPADVAQNIALHSADEALSAREIEVLRSVAMGKANKEIAWLLSITEDTVKAHLKSIFAKLEVADRTHAVTVALKRGILEI